MFNNSFSENRALYEIMSKNMVEPVKPQLRFACKVSEATRVHTQEHAHAKATA